MTEFRKFPSIGRLRREAVITEKIDGTNACVVVEEYAFGEHVDKDTPPGCTFTLGPNWGSDGLPDHEYVVSAQSRKQRISPGKKTDNHGFAAWVWENAATLAQLLGPGYHYGEWWGNGINRGYGLGPGDKRFSLFNTNRYANLEVSSIPALGVVPVVNSGEFTDRLVDFAVSTLHGYGSQAAPGYYNVEGIVVWHKASNALFKWTFDGDGHKSV